ncbi:MAG: hypothetical protein IKO99_02025 [Bacteroidales bacterium]|nr:hypothetical protein [Bacteroidales bacterium]
MKRILISLITLSCICCCSKNDNETTDMIPSDTWSSGDYTGNYMDMFIIPKEITLQYFADEYNSPSISIQPEMTEGKSEFFPYWEKNENKLKQYNAYAEYFGDTVYDGYHDMGLVEQVFAVPIKSISIVANRDFDAEHPRGSNLGDVFSLQYLSFYSFIKNGCKNGINNTIWPADSLSKLTEIKSISLFSWRGGTQINFDKLPEIPGKYTFTVTLDFGCDPLTGEKVTVPPASIEIEF